MTITKKLAEAAGTAPADKISEMQSYSNALCAPGEWNRVENKRGFISITVPRPRKSSPGSQ